MPRYCQDGCHPKSKECNRACQSCDGGGADPSMVEAKKPKIGSKWKTVVELNGNKYNCKGKGDSIFDELIIDDFLHLEQMNHNTWWMRVGDAAIWVTLKKNGKVKVTINRDEY